MPATGIGGGTEGNKLPCIRGHSAGRKASRRLYPDDRARRTSLESGDILVTAQRPAYIQFHGQPILGVPYHPDLVLGAAMIERGLPYRRINRALNELVSNRRAARPG